MSTVLREDSRSRVGVLLTLAELYRQSMPGLSEEYTAYWRKSLDKLLGRHATLHFAETAHSAEEVARGVQSCEQAGCDLLLALPMAYAPSGAAIDALAETRLPIMVVSTSRDATLSAQITHEDLRANQAMHGVQDLANLLRRRGRQFVIVAGHGKQESFGSELKRICKAATGARILRCARVGRLGTPFSGMLDFSFTRSVLQEKLGLEVIEIQPELLEQKATEMKSKELKEFLSSLRSQYQMDPALTDEELNTTAKWSRAFEKLAEDLSLEAIAMNFEAVLDAGVETLPFLGADRLMSRGIGYAGEGDVLTAALNRALHRMCGESTFTEAFCPDYEKNEILLSHMGECNIALADPNRPILLKAKPFSIGKCTRPAVPVFQLKPGIVTLASLSEAPVGPDDRPSGFQLVVFRGEIVPSAEHAKLISPYSRLRIPRDLAGFLESYSRAGGTHHLALGYGDLGDELAMLAALAGLQLYRIEV